MKIISWNVRGLGGVRKRRAVRECVSKFNPTILILHETKKECMCSRLVKSVVGNKLVGWCAFPRCGTSGGILFAWDPTKVTKLDEIVGNFSVSIKIAEVSLGFEWLIFGVYGPCRPQQRFDFWDELLSVRTQWGGPWVVVGVTSMSLDLHMRRTLCFLDWINSWSLILGKRSIPISSKKPFPKSPRIIGLL